MRIYNGNTDIKIYFIAVDATDLTTRETSLTNTAVWYSIKGGAKDDMTTPTITHIQNGVHSLDIDEPGMVTLVSTDETAELVVEISADEMATVTRVLEVYRPKITPLRSLEIDANGAASRVTLVDTTTTNTDMAAGAGTPSLV